MTRRLLWGGTTIRAAALLAMMAAVACGKDKEAESADAAAHPVVGVRTVVVQPQAFTETLGAMGTVAPRAGHIATLSAPAAGRVSRVLVTTGQTVQAGKTLIELDQAPFQAALQSANVALTAAERANERAQRLAQEGIVPRKEAEQTAAELAKARADAVAARRTEQLSTLHSPISGVVTRMSATLGASVDPAQPLVEISDPSALDVLLSVTPSDAARVHPGTKVSLSAGQSASGEPLGVGTVADISGTVDSATRTVAIRVQAPTTRRPLRIGETVYGAISVGTRPTAIVIPAEALVPEGDQFKVFVVDGAGIAHERDVTVGSRSNAGIEIRDGLQAGERIVTYGAYGVQDSAKVVQLAPASTAPARPAQSATPAKP
jgi:membrane fusion protein (multidrug efflux system)